MHLVELNSDILRAGSYKILFILKIQLDIVRILDFKYHNIKLILQDLIRCLKLIKSKRFGQKLCYDLP